MKKGKVLLGFGGAGLATASVVARWRQILAVALKLPPVRYKVKVDHTVKIEMPDGVKLAASLYSPQASGKFPTVLVRTPYGRLTALTTLPARIFAERGYNVLVQDVRGRFDSEGEFVPFHDEAADGKATVDWLAKQSWFDGSIGTWGPSYLGFVQWAVAPHASPYLKAMVPCITSSEFYTVTRDIFGVDGALRWLQILSTNSQKDSKNAINPLFTAAQNRKLKQSYNVLPVGAADTVATGKMVKFYRDWIAHSTLDEYWQQADHSATVSEITAPIHFVSGWDDFMLPQLLSDYARVKAAGHTPYLTVGPYSHLTIAGLWQQVRQALIWFDANMHGDKSRLRQKPVRIYVTGAKQWRELESWPPVAQSVSYYLHDGKALNNKATEASSQPDTFVFDPENPVPTVGGALFSPEAGSKDNRAVEARPDVLTYTTEPLSRDLEVIGPVRLELFVASDHDYADVFGRLCEVYPDGRSMNITDGIHQIAPDRDNERLPDGSYKLAINLWPTAHTFKAGNRLRLQVSSAPFPRFARNPGTGESLLGANHLQKSKQIIYHDVDHPSCLSLPVTNSVPD